MFASDKVVNETSFSDPYSGIYEAILKRKHIGSFTKKNLVRLHLYRNDYGTSRHFTYDNGELNPNRKPKYIFGMIEEFDNKNGKGEPRVTYFRGVSDEKEYGLKIELFPRIRSISDVIRIPKMRINEEKEIEIFKKNKWFFEKVKTYNKRPEIFDEYFRSSLNQYVLKNNYTKQHYLQLGNSSYGGIKLLTEDFTEPKDTLRVILKNASVSPSGSEDFDWIRNTKGGIFKALRGDGNSSISEMAIFLPEAKYLKIYVNTPVGSRRYDESNHFFGIKITRDDSGVKTNFAETLKGEDYRIKANMVYNEKERERSKRMQENIIAQEKAEKEAKKEFLKIMAETTSTGEPTEKQMKLAMFQKYNPGKKKEKLWIYMNADKYRSTYSEMGEFINSLKSIVSFDIVDFKKKKCKPTNDKGVFTCDYQIKISSENEFNDLMGKYSNAVYSNKTSRFTKVPGNWVSD